MLYFTEKLAFYPVLLPFRSRFHFLSIIERSLMDNPSPVAYLHLTKLYNMTPEEIFDQYAMAMLTGIGAKVAEMSLNGDVEASVLQRLVSSAMQAAQAAYNMRGDYLPGDPN